MPQLDFLSFIYQFLNLVIFFNLFYFIIINHFLINIKYNFVSREFFILKNLIKIFRNNKNKLRIINFSTTHFYFNMREYSHIYLVYYFRFIKK